LINEETMIICFYSFSCVVIGYKCFKSLDT